MDQFTFIGKISAIKETENFKPIDRKTFDTSGWQMTNVKFNCISGTNRIMCIAQGGKFKDDSKNIIKTVGQPPAGGGKRPLIDIAWDKRNDPDEIAKVAGFKHFVVDLDDYKMRYKLRDLVKAFKEDGDTDDLVAETGCETLNQATEALEKSEKRRHVFLSAWDFAEYMAKVVVSEKVKDKMFRISGNREIQYSKGKFYSNYMVNRVELINDVEPNATMNIDFYFAEDCVDENDDNGIGYINGWGNYYDSQLKKNGFYPICIVSRGGEKEIKGLRRKLSVGESEIATVGLTVNVIDGAEIVPSTYDDLSDEDKADIDDGFITLEEIIKASNGGKVGDKITELRYAGLNPRKRNIEDTDFSVENMVPATMEIEDNESDDEDEDL